MTEKATIYQAVQVGIETTPGTAVAATKKLLACSIVPSARVESDAFRPAGNKYPSFVTIGKEYSEARLDGRLTYNEILYILSSLIEKPTPTQLTGTTAYKWTFSPATSAEDAGITLTVEQGDSTTAWRAAGVRVSGLELTFNRNECTIGGSAIGLPIESNSLTTSGVTSLTPLPVLPAHLKLYMADSQTGLATANPLDRAFSLTWSITDKVGLSWPIGEDAVTVETVPGLTAKLRLAMDSTGVGLISTMRSSAIKWFQLEADGDAINASYDYTFTLTFPAEISDMSDFSDEDGIYAVEFTLQGIHDATFGHAFEIEVITDVSAL